MNVAADSNGIYVAVVWDKPNRICNTGIIVAKENSDNIVDKILKNRLATTCQRYGGTKRFKSDRIFMQLDNFKAIVYRLKVGIGDYSRGRIRESVDQKQIDHFQDPFV